MRGAGNVENVDINLSYYAYRLVCFAMNLEELNSPLTRAGGHIPRTKAHCVYERRFISRILQCDNFPEAMVAKINARGSIRPPRGRDLRTLGFS